VHPAFEGSCLWSVASRTNLFPKTTGGINHQKCCFCCVLLNLQGLARLEELVRKLVDIVDNRVMANMAAVQNTLLVELPGDR